MRNILIGGIILCLILVVSTLTGEAQQIFWRFNGNPTVYDSSGYSFSSPEEFLNAGGDWDNVRIVGEQSFGSVSRVSEYHGTTTTSAGTPSYTTLLTGPGTLGSVVITGTSSGAFYLYDATSTNYILRTPPSATSSLNLLCQIAPYAPHGTYTFDRIFTKGLLFVSVGTVPTSTITYRP